MKFKAFATRDNDAGEWAAGVQHRSINIHKVRDLCNSFLTWAQSITFSVGFKAARGTLQYTAILGDVDSACPKLPILNYIICF